MPLSHARPPQLLVASHHTGPAGEVQPLAERRGYGVRRAYTGTQALDLASAAPPVTHEHHQALRAGVWEYLSHPFHPEEMAVKLDGYVLMKLDADRARRDQPVTDEEGFYTLAGLALRAQQLTLQAFHHAEP